MFQCTKQVVGVYYFGFINFLFLSPLIHILINKCKKHVFTKDFSLGRGISCASCFELANIPLCVFKHSMVKLPVRSSYLRTNSSMLLKKIRLMGFFQTV